MKFRVYNFFHRAESLEIDVEEGDCPVCEALRLSDARADDLFFFGVDNWLGRGQTVIRRALVVAVRPFMLIECSTVSMEDARVEHNASCLRIH
jgi:hypothetical protein